MNAGTAAIVGLILVAGGIGVYFVAKGTKPPATLIAQAPSPAVAGIQALGLLASKGIDAWIAAKANKSDSED